MNPVMRTTTAALVLAPIVMLASTIAYVMGNQGLSAGAAAGTLQIWAFIAYAIALVGLVRALERDAPRLAATGLVLALIGCVGGGAYGMDSIQAAVLGGTIDSSPAAPFALRIPGLAFPLALLIFGVVLTRSRVTSPPSSALVIVGAVLFPVARIADIAAVAVASDLALLVGFCWIAAQMANRSSEPAIATRDARTSDDGDRSSPTRSPAPR